ncbi:hypothetical protein R3P38DRAFT_3230928 [Favolaschia claudopus]|uniref:Uncharacterized protein n=1 Tax=Favolaschia claudopus TaxID=2862362 RepID=A0AAV9ZL43_9AGAR
MNPNSPPQPSTSDCQTPRTAAAALVDITITFGVGAMYADSRNHRYRNLIGIAFVTLRYAVTLPPPPSPSTRSRSRPAAAAPFTSVVIPLNTQLLSPCFQLAPAVFLDKRDVTADLDADVPPRHTAPPVFLSSLALLIPALAKLYTFF